MQTSTTLLAAAAVWLAISGRALTDTAPDGSAAPDVTNQTAPEPTTGQDPSPPWNIPNEQRHNLTELDSSSLQPRHTHIRQQDMKDFPNLERFNLSNSGIKEIDADSFLLNAELQELDISLTDLKIPSNSTMFVSSSLQNLIWSDSNLNELHSDILAELPNLQSLDISSNTFKSFAEDVFQKTPKLKNLIISRDDKIQTEYLCEKTSIETLYVKIEDGRLEHEEIINCSKYKTKNIIIEESKNDTEQNSTTDIIERKIEIKPVDTEEKNSTEKSVDEPVKASSESAVNVEVTEVPLKVSDKPAEPEKVPTEPPKDNKVTKTDDSEKPKEVVKSIEEKIETPPEIKPEDLPDIIQKDLNKEAPKDVQEVEEKRANIQSQPDSPNDKNLASAESTSDTNSSGISATNIVLGIIVCVAVIGTVSFGYQYWKKHRGYTHTNTDDNHEEEGKELQTITTSNHHTDDEENK